MKFWKSLLEFIQSDFWRSQSLGHFIEKLRRPSLRSISLFRSVSYRTDLIMKLSVKNDGQNRKRSDLRWFNISGVLAFRSVKWPKSKWYFTNETSFKENKLNFLLLFNLFSSFASKMVKYYISLLTRSG